TCRLVIEPVTSSSGSMIRRSDARFRRSIRAEWSDATPSDSTCVRVAAMGSYRRENERLTQILNSSGTISAVPPDPSPTTKGERTRKVLLDAAIDRFGRDGYRGTSVAEIARDARLSGTAAYAYFANKEALFIAAVDEDAAAVIHEGLSTLTDDVNLEHWRRTLMVTLTAAVERHPLARRVLSGLEPEFTVRLLGIPALEQLRKESGDRIRAQQLAGQVR